MQKSLGGGWRLPKDAHHAPAAAMAQISQNTMSSTIGLPPREEGTGHHCKRWARFDVGPPAGRAVIGFLRAPASRMRPRKLVRGLIDRDSDRAFKLTRLGRDVLTELLKD